jgi:hypothetical protein
VLTVQAPAWFRGAAADQEVWSKDAAHRHHRLRGAGKSTLATALGDRLELPVHPLDWWICTYRKTRRPAILERRGRCDSQQRVIVLASRRAIAAFLREFHRRTGAV